MSAPARSRVPNVVLVICDDLAWGDLACHGNRHVRTPYLDRLAGEGTELTRYCSGPLCSPARASLLTGRYHLRTRVLDTYCGRSMMDPDERTLASCLQNAGYRTGAFGKWHLGDCYPMRPMDKGFEESLVHRAGGIGQPGDHPQNHARWHEDSYFDPILYRNGTAVQTQGYCSDIFTDATCEFIESNGDEPFFAYLAYNAPHSPHLVADRWVDRYRKMGINETHSRVYGMVENIDWNVGRLLARLEELELADDTLVIFTSDHGPCGSARYEGKDRWNAELRGRKGSMYEGGIRVPSLWRWPGHFPAGQQIDRIAHPIDLLPTCLSACGVEQPQDRTIDGVDLLPLLRDEVKSDGWPERALFMQWHRGDVPVRHRNYAVIDQQYKLTRAQEDRPDELYDLVQDPHERRDIANGHAQRVAQMRSQYNAWFDEMAATRGLGTFDPPPIVLGTPWEQPTLLTRQDWRIVGQEGWNRDDLRGRWEVTVTQAGQYEVTVRFGQDVPAGTVYLRLSDGEVTQRAEQGEVSCILPPLSLAQGRDRIEAWRQLDEPHTSALYGRFLPALYVEIRGPVHTPEVKRVT